jgi:hypothetical protein
MPGYVNQQSPLCRAFCAIQVWIGLALGGGIL